MKCPYCSYPESKVIDSRPADEGVSIRRRRECLSCLKRFTTYEIIEKIPLMIIKKNKSREQFDKNKLLNGLLRACQKRPISLNTLEEVVNDIEATLYNSLEKEITSKLIGELALQHLT
jgi:transcriptional repressor NrdR